MRLRGSVCFIADFDMTSLNPKIERFILVRHSGGLILYMFSNFQLNTELGLETSAN